MQRVIDGPDSHWLTAKEVAHFLGIGLTLFRELLSANEFPAPVAIGRRAGRWHWLTPVAWAHLRSLATPEANGKPTSKPKA